MHVHDIQTENDGGNYFTLSHVSLHAKTNGCCCLERRFERPTIQKGRVGYCRIQGETVGCRLFEETIDPYITTSGKTPSVSLFSSKFLSTVSMRQVICSAGLRLVLKPNFSLCRSQ